MKEKVFYIKQAKPKTFDETNYNSKLKYMLSPKIDGVRRLVLVNNGNIRFLTGNKVHISNKSTLLEGEVIDREFYAFDILFVEGNDLRDLNFGKRLDILKLFCSKNKIKTQLYLDCNCENLKELLKIKMVLHGPVDGIIFTPDLPYNSGFDLKWKPTKLLSIDFKIKKENGNFNLLRQNGNVFDTIKVSKKIYNSYKDNSVVEFVFVRGHFGGHFGGHFVPYRSRPDKEMSNHDSVIEHNLIMLNKNVDIKKVLGCK